MLVGFQVVIQGDVPDIANVQSQHFRLAWSIWCSIRMTATTSYLRQHPLTKLFFQVGVTSRSLDFFVLDVMTLHPKKNFDRQVLNYCSIMTTFNISVL